MVLGLTMRLSLQSLWAAIELGVFLTFGIFCYFAVKKFQKKWNLLLSEWQTLYNGLALEWCVWNVNITYNNCRLQLINGG